MVVQDVQVETGRHERHSFALGQLSAAVLLLGADLVGLHGSHEHQFICVGSDMTENFALEVGFAVVWCHSH